MSSFLYLLFDNVGMGGDSIARHVRTMGTPGYSFWDKAEGIIKAPEEQELPVRCYFYAQNYFRVLVADLAVEFCRETTPPPELIAGERLLCSRILDLPEFRLRRWVAASEGWDDDNKKFVHILSQGTSRETLPAVPGAPPNGGPGGTFGNSGASGGPPSVS